MNKEFQDQLNQARRAQLIEAAIEVIAEHGFQRTTIKQIAKKAGVADGTIYNYFKNKDDILLGIVTLLTEAEEREMHFAEAQQIDFREFVAEYVTHRMAEVDLGYPVLKAILPETIVNPEINRIVNEQVYAPSFAIAEQYLQRLMEKGDLPKSDPVVAARLFASPLLGLLFLRMLGDEHVAENWDLYSNAMGQFMLNAYAEEKNGENDND